MKDYQYRLEAPNEYISCLRFLFVPISSSTAINTHTSSWKHIRSQAIPQTTTLATSTRQTLSSSLHITTRHNQIQSTWLARMSSPQPRSTSLSLLLWHFPKTSLMTRRARAKLTTTPRLVFPTREVDPMTRTAPPRHLTLLAIPPALTSALALESRLASSRLAQAS